MTGDVNFIKHPLRLSNNLPQSIKRNISQNSITNLIKVSYPYYKTMSTAATLLITQIIKSIHTSPQLWTLSPWVISPLWYLVRHFIRKTSPTIYIHIYYVNFFCKYSRVLLCSSLNFQLNDHHWLHFFPLEIIKKNP